MSSSLHSLVQVANNDFVITAFDKKTHEFSPEGTALASSICASFDTLFDHTEGFSTKKSVESLISHCLREAAITGAVAGELVFNKAFIPDRIQIVPFESLIPVGDGKGGFYYEQSVQGENDNIELNIPNFYVSFLQHDAGQPFAQSLFDSAVKLLILFEEMLEDIRKVVRQSGHSRTTVNIDTQKLVASAPADVRGDPVKLKSYMENVRDGMVEQLENLTPEQALVLFDYAKAEVLNSGLGTKVDYTPLLNTISGLHATSMKTPPSAVGLRLEGGSQALGNIESLIFLKAAKALQTPVEEVFSRALTLSCRMLGSDVYVRLQFKPINLRPEEELESFKTMRQTRILEALSYGFITDEYASHLLGYSLRPAGSPSLSGTFFLSSKSNPVNSGFPGDTAMGRVLQPDSDIPRKGGGRSQ